MHGAPKAPWSAVAPATAFTIDQLSSLLTETLKRASFVIVGIQVLYGLKGGSWRYRTPGRAAPAPAHCRKVVGRRVSDLCPSAFSSIWRTNTRRKHRNHAGR